MTRPPDIPARIYITANRDGESVLWSRDPAAKPTFALSAGAAVDKAIEGLGGAPAVIVWSGVPAPP